MSNDTKEVGCVMPSGKVVYVPSADSFKATFCSDPECTSVHIFLCDHMEQPFAEATLTIEQIDGILDLFETLARS